MARRRSFWRRLTGWLTAPRVAALLLGVFGVLVGFGGYLYQYCPCQGWPNLVAGWEQLFLDFYANVAASLVTITIAVLTIDWLNERRAEQQLKAQLIREMGSPDNGIALRAVRELEARGWLYDGSLHEADLYRADLHGGFLQEADLQGANLYRADLHEAFLQGADLRRAFLMGANLQGASLIAVNLQEARGLTALELVTALTLHEATMPDGSHYNGCFSLKGDIEYARLGKPKSGNPESMADFFGVSLEDYRAGQEWARENLPRLRREAGLEQEEAAETVEAPQPEEPQSAAPSSSAPPVLSTQSLLSFTIGKLVGLF